MTAKWPWSRSLAVTGKGRTVQVKRILFGAVEDRCHGLGIRPGSILTCEGQDDDDITLTLPGGERHRLPRHYAWFVSVDPIS